MNFILTLAYLFFVGSVSGWVLELFFRKFFSASNPEHKWINPGFCTGPYLPIYGFGLCALYLLALLGSGTGLDGSIQGRALLFLGMAVSMTLIEYLGGLMLLKGAKIRLWDYSNCRGNIQGLICPLFSFFWVLLGTAYYFLIHPHILTALAWLSENLAFSFVIGLFFGVFLVDMASSAHWAARVKAFADANGVSLCRCERRDREGRESQSPYPSRTGTGFHARSFLFRFSLRASPRRTSEGGA